MDTAVGVLVRTRRQVRECVRAGSGRRLLPEFGRVVIITVVSRRTRDCRGC